MSLVLLSLKKKKMLLEQHCNKTKITRLSSVSYSFEQEYSEAEFCNSLGIFL